MADGAETKFFLATARPGATTRASRGGGETRPAEAVLKKR
jgi:hypothetical protein